MSYITDLQKELLFDYCMGLTSKEQTTEAETLISTNQKAAEICSQIKAALSPLDSLESQSCPADLAESTIVRLNNAARTSQLHLQKLLAKEQAMPVTNKGWEWQGFSQRLATAAVFMLVGGLFLTAWNTGRQFIHQKYQQNQCQMQLSQIASGVANYAADHDNTLPVVASTAGSPWWKVGDSGKENNSNTRNLWLLVKKGYVNPANFVCPGRMQRRTELFDVAVVEKLDDFPDRRFITYSLQVMNGRDQRCTVKRKTLMADLNPLFEVLPHNYADQLNLQPDKELLNLNSFNHGRRGQNVMFTDGSVEFKKKRCVGNLKDDIFTLQNTAVYRGVEVSTCETDTFLAP